MNTQQQTPIETALSDIEKILYDFDDWTQIRIALPWLRSAQKNLQRAVNAKSNNRSHLAHDRCDARWVDDIATALRGLPGVQHIDHLYREVEHIRKAAGRSWPKNAHSAIREKLQAFCADAPQYKGGADLFRNVAWGYWALKN